MSICWRRARPTSLSMSTLSTSIRWEHNFLLKLSIQPKRMLKYVHHPNYQITEIFVLQTQTASCSDSKGGLSQSFESGNKSSSSRAASSGRKLSLLCQNWTLFIPQCISSDSAATISSHFLSSHHPSNVFSPKPSKFYTQLNLFGHHCWNLTPIQFLILCLSTSTTRLLIIMRKFNLR